MKGGFFDSALIGSTEETNNSTQFLIKINFDNFNAVQKTEKEEVKCHLNNPYPNPSNGLYTISYNVSKESNIELEIFNVIGQKVETIFSGTQKPGNYNFIWRTGNLSSGIYYCRFKTKEFTETKKISLLK